MSSSVCPMVASLFQCTRWSPSPGTWRELGRMPMCLLPFLETLASRPRFTWRASEFERFDFIGLLSKNISQSLHESTSLVWHFSMPAVNLYLFFFIPLWSFSTEKRYFLTSLSNCHISVLVLDCIVHITLYERSFLPNFRAKQRMFTTEICGHGAGISRPYSCAKRRTQTMWSKEELCDMAGLRFHSEANERRPPCHFCGWSDDSQGILPAPDPPLSLYTLIDR